MMLAYLCNYFPSLSETFIYREVLELKSRSIPVRCYSLRRPPVNSLSAEAVALSQETSYLLPLPLKEVLGAHLVFCFTRPGRYFTCLVKMIFGTHHHLRDRWRSLLHFGEGVVLAKWMQRDGISHIHGQFASQSTSVARVVSLVTGIPYSFSAHAHDIWEDRILLPEKLRETKFAVCCSAHGQAELRKQGATQDQKKVHLVYHGIDIARFSPPIIERTANRLILSVGRLDAMKGYHDLIAACKALKDDNVTFDCRIVGEGEERSRLTQLIGELGLENEVKLVGAVPQEKILAHYHEASFFVLPSVKTKTNRYDGVPNVLVEAMATGLPVISTRVGGIPELITDEADGFLVDPGCPEKLAGCMKRLLLESGLRERMGVAAREKVCTGFDRSRCIEPLLELMESKCGFRSATGKSVLAC